MEKYWNGTIPWIKSGELLDNDLYDSEEHITHLGLKESSAKEFPKDTILVALYGQGKTRGKTARLMKKASTNQACCAILPHSSINPQYLQYWIRSLYWELRQNIRGGAQPNWNATTIKNIEIVIPPLRIQNSLVRILDKKFLQMVPIENSLDKLYQRRKTFSEYFKNISLSILSQAFTDKFVNSD